VGASAVWDRIAALGGAWLCFKCSASAAMIHYIACTPSCASRTQTKSLIVQLKIHSFQALAVSTCHMSLLCKHKESTRVHPAVLQVLHRMDTEVRIHRMIAHEALVTLHTHLLPHLWCHNGINPSCFCCFDNFVPVAACRAHDERNPIGRIEFSIVCRQDTGT
jgi:hypothetical protein